MLRDDSGLLRLHVLHDQGRLRLLHLHEQHADLLRLLTSRHVHESEHGRGSVYCDGEAATLR